MNTAGISLSSSAYFYIDRHEKDALFIIFLLIIIRFCYIFDQWMLESFIASLIKPLNYLPKLFITDSRKIIISKNMNLIREVGW